MKVQKICIAACAAVFIIGCIWSLALIFKPHGETVKISQDGKILYVIDISKSDDRVIEIETNGSKNTICIKNHKIYMESAECPDKLCVKMGELKSSASPIICLPNKIIIEYIESENIDGEVR